MDGITGCVRDSSLQGQRIICRFLSVTLAGKGQMMETSVASQNRNICQACALIHIPAQGSHALAFRRPMLALDFNHPPVIKVEPIPIPLSVPPTCHMFINKTKWLCDPEGTTSGGLDHCSAILSGFKNNELCFDSQLQREH